MDYAPVNNKKIYFAIVMALMFLLTLLLFHTNYSDTMNLL